MVIGALLEPNMGTPLKSASLALVGASSCDPPAGLACFSSNCRICRSSCRISSPCCCVIGFLSDFWAASGSAANTVTNTRNFFIGYLVLPQDEHVPGPGRPPARSACRPAATRRACRRFSWGAYVDFLHVLP